MTGTAQLLEHLSPYVPDAFINERWPRGATGGRRRAFSAAQLWRTHLLVLLSPAHSINLLVSMLKEQSQWRRFGHLSHRKRIPDVRMLHEFRNEVGVDGLRSINEHLLGAVIKPVIERPDSIAIIDATDLPAACSRFKKTVAAAAVPMVLQSVTAP
jgi:hypothetical protein